MLSKRRRMEVEAREQAKARAAADRARTAAAMADVRALDAYAATLPTRSVLRALVAEVLRLRRRVERLESG